MRAIDHDFVKLRHGCMQTAHHSNERFLLQGRSAAGSNAKGACKSSGIEATAMPGEGASTNEQVVLLVDMLHFRVVHNLSTAVVTSGSMPHSAAGDPLHFKMVHNVCCTTTDNQ